MSDHPACGTCRFWDHADDGGPLGTCRVNPPVVVKADTHGFWPGTDEFDWCGMHQHRPAAIGKPASAPAKARAAPAG